MKMDNKGQIQNIYSVGLSLALGAVFYYVGSYLLTSLNIGTGGIWGIALLIIPIIIAIIALMGLMVRR